MSHQSIKNRSLYSTVLTLVFFILLSVYLAFIEFFHDNQNDKSALDLLRSPIGEDYIARTNSIIFKNRLGKIVLNKKQDNWFISQPQSLPANEKTISILLNSLVNFDVQTIHDKEPINIESFSLNNPIVSVELFTELDENTKIDFGLFNPIDNTSYIATTNSNIIYQTLSSQTVLQRFELGDFIDAKIFSMSQTDLASFKLYNYKNKDPMNNFTKQNNTWATKKFRVVSNDKISTKLESILNIPTHLIIDQKDEKLRNFIENYLENPLHRITVTLNSGKKVEYKVSNLTQAIQELKIPKKQYFIMSASDRPYPFIVSKDYLPNFKIRYNDIRP